MFVKSPATTSIVNNEIKLAYEGPTTYNKVFMLRACSRVAAATPSHRAASATKGKGLRFIGVMKTERSTKWGAFIARPAPIVYERLQRLILLIYYYKKIYFWW